MSIKRRHLLLEVSQKGREFAWELLKYQFAGEKNTDIAKVRQLILTGYEGILIPGIARRKQTPPEREILETSILESSILETSETQGNPGIFISSAEVSYKTVETVAVGFSSPYRINDQRRRIPTLVPKQEITKTISPYELLELEFPRRTKCLEALDELQELALRLNVKLGVWGSAGLEVYTTLAYTDKDSDLDLIIQNPNLDQIAIFYEKVKLIEGKYNCRVDLELELKEYEIKVAEILANQEFVLGKSIEGVQLYSKEEVLDLLG